MAGSTPAERLQRAKSEMSEAQRAAYAGMSAAKKREFDLALEAASHNKGGMPELHRFLSQKLASMVGQPRAISDAAKANASEMVKAQKAAGLEKANAKFQRDLALYKLKQKKKT